MKIHYTIILVLLTFSSVAQFKYVQTEFEKRINESRKNYVDMLTLYTSILKTKETQIAGYQKVINRLTSKIELLQDSVIYGKLIKTIRPEKGVKIAKGCYPIHLGKTSRSSIAIDYKGTLYEIGKAYFDRTINEKANKISYEIRHLESQIKYNKNKMSKLKIESSPFSLKIANNDKFFKSDSLSILAIYQEKEVERIAFNKE